MRILSLSLLMLLAGCGDPDADADGYTESTDCDDQNPAINPGATEVPYDGLDNDCSPQTRDDDLDLDGYTADVDCDDSLDQVHPGGAEICDGLDNDCDEQIDVGAGTAYYRYGDSDGYGDAAKLERHCAQQDGWVTELGDCDDSDDAIFPGADEICNGADDDCDGLIDNSPVDADTYYIDYDADGYGSDAYTQVSCTPPGAGWVSNATDCKDTSNKAYPGAVEICDGTDNNCNGQTDESGAAPTTWYLDNDKDGLGNSARSVVACSKPSNDYVSVGGDPDDNVPQ